MGKKRNGKKNGSVSKRIAKIEREMEKDKPEVKTLDVLTDPIGTGIQYIQAGGIYNGTGLVTYDLTNGFVQGLLNTGGNIDGNYCKLTSMDLRILLTYPTAYAGTDNVSRIRLMIIRLPATATLTPVDVQRQVLEYGDPGTFANLTLVSPWKRNTSINGGYDVYYDKVHLLTGPALQLDPAKSQKYIRFKKKWKEGLTLRFSGPPLTLEQNRIFLFAMDPLHNPAAIGAIGPTISFINRIRYSDE